MLPPLDSAVSLANPRFEALYNDLCKNKLRADGTSSLDHDAQKQRNAFESELLQARVYSARKDVVSSALKELIHATDTAPTRLHELLIIAAAVLDGLITGEDVETIQDSMTSFEEQLPAITIALSERVQEHADRFTALTAGNITRADLSPEDVLTTWREKVEASRQMIFQSRWAQITVARDIHDTQSQLIEVCIRVLEQTIHGACSRGTKGKADYLATVALGMSKKLDVQYGQVISQIDSEQIRAALKARTQELAEQSRVLKAQYRDLQEELEACRAEQSNMALTKEYIQTLRSAKDVRAAIDSIHS